MSIEGDGRDASPQASAPQDLKAYEELKRERAYSPLERWKAIQATITWAEANLPYEKRRNRPRV